MKKVFEGGAYESSLKSFLKRNKKGESLKTRISLIHIYRIKSEKR